MLLDAVLEILSKITTANSSPCRGSARFILSGDKSLNLYMSEGDELPSFGEKIAIQV